MKALQGAVRIVFPAVAMFFIAASNGQAQMPSPLTPDSGITADTSAMAEKAWSDPGWGEMTPERRAQAIAYSDTKHTLYFVDIFYSFIVLGLVLATGFSGRVRAWADRLGKRRFFVWAIYLLALSIVLWILDFPLTYYTGFALEHKYDLSNQTFGAWLWEGAKGEAISYLVGLILIWLVYVAIRRSPRRWWLWVGAAAAPVAAFLIVLAPIIVAPMFNKFTPLQNQELKAKILNLASQAGIEDSKVFEVDASKQSKKYNAYVTGLFGSKRIVLYDTILQDMKEDEILFVMSHEMGHYVMHHIWLGVASITVFVLISAFLVAQIADRLIMRFGPRWRFTSLSDFASFPLIALLFAFFGFISQPVFSGMSRHFEHKADEYGLRMTDNPQAAASAFEKLAAKNLSNPEPSAFIEFWLYDHPTIKKRVEYVLGKRTEG
jgi:Zn-dependent protease with chaperone function